MMPSKQSQIEQANWEALGLAKSSIVGFVSAIVEGDEISDRVKARAKELLKAHDRARENFWRGTQDNQSEADFDNGPLAATHLEMGRPV